MGKMAGSLTGNIWIMILFSLLTIAVLALMEFLNLSLNYKSAQDLEFEDEDYFDQVRANPKINPVAKSKKKIKTVHEVSGPRAQKTDGKNQIMKNKEEMRVKGSEIKSLRREDSKAKAMSELFDK